VLIVVRGYNYREDLRALKPYIREYRPMLVGVDGGADALLEDGYTPDLIVGDMDSVSDATLRCGAELVVHAYRDGRAPGADRLERLGLNAVTFPATGTSEDVAMLLADSKGASLIVAVGSHAALVEFLDKGRAGMASTFLTRLRVGGKLIDAKGVSRLYRSRISTTQVVVVLLVGIVAFLVRAGLADVPAVAVARPHLLDPRTLHVIDFKQFLTTIAAIFLALAVGVALGAGPLKGTADEQLRINAEKLSKDKDTLQKQILADQAQAKYQDSFADAISPELVSGRLTERKVAIVTLPGASGADTKAITTLVEAADGTVTGTIAVQSKFFDPTQAQFVDGVTTQSSGAVSTADLAVPTTATGYERAGYVLARALVSKGNGAGQDATAQTILAAFKDAGLVKAPDKLERASLVVVIAGPAPAPADLDSIDPTAAVGLLLGLDASCEGTVVAGPPEAAADNGTIALIRADDNAKKVISTVDQAELPAGRLSAIFALVEQIDGKTGHYGMVGKVDAAAPKLTSP